MIWYDLYDILTMDQSLKNISISKKIIKLSFSLSKKTHLLWMDLYSIEKSLMLIWRNWRSSKLTEID